MFVSTKSSQLRNDAEASFKSVVYENSYKSKTSSKKDSEPDMSKFKANDEKNLEEKNAKELDPKKIRYEIIKFGTSGFNGSKKEENLVNLAVTLGAKPPKNKHKNYKRLLGLKKAEKAQEMKTLGNEKLKRPYFVSGKKSFRSRPNSKHTKGLLDVYGKVTNSKAIVKFQK